MYTLGLCTTQNSPDLLCGENLDIYVEAQKLYDLVMLINPQLVTFEFIMKEDKPGIFLGQYDISTTNSLVVRGTSSREISTALLVHTLNLCGCDVLDSISRFVTLKSSKLFSTIRLFSKGTGISTFVAFCFKESMYLIRKLYNEGHFPLIAKPIHGKKGIGIKKLVTLNDAVDYVHLFFQTQIYSNNPLYLQKFIDFKEEYRVIVLDGFPIGMVRKVLQDGNFTANAAQGAMFFRTQKSSIMQFVLGNISTDGIIGVDVGVDANDNLYIIESNRAPLWKNFEQATNINISQILVERALERLIRQ